MIHNLIISSLSEERVRKGAEKLAKFLNAKQQGRLDGFFTVQQKTSPEKGGKGKGKESAGKGTKRKGDEKKDASASKKSKKK